MKTQTLEQLRALDKVKLQAELEKALAQKMSVTMHLVAQSEKDSSKLGKIKTYIAQIKTVQRERQLADLSLTAAA